MYILVIGYSKDDIHVVYFAEKQKARLAYKNFKKKAKEGEWAILSKVIKEFQK